MKALEVRPLAATFIEAVMDILTGVSDDARSNESESAT